jgi:anti-sigma factor RsiW
LSIVFRKREPELACQEVVELISDYLEEALSASDRRRLEHHLAGCPHCSAYLAQMRETLRVAGRLAPEDLSPEMTEEFSEIFRRWTDERD